MKKAIKFISLILCLILFTISFTGCKALDTKRKNQAFWNNKKQTEILLDGKIYKKLPACEYLSPSYIARQDGMHVTKKDVPVLLAGLLSGGYSYSIDKEKGLLFVNGSYFAREDCYKKYEDMINGYTLNKYATVTGAIVGNQAYEGAPVLFNRQEEELINAVLASKTEAPSIEREEEYSSQYMPLFLSDETLMFSKNIGEFRLYEKQNKIQYFDGEKYFTVADEYFEALKEMIIKYREKPADKLP